ncbi:MAG: hypothetical protein ACYTE3_29500, partial [Planctomycetota bacterium]
VEGLVDRIVAAFLLLTSLGVIPSAAIFCHFDRAQRAEKSGRQLYRLLSWEPDFSTSSRLHRDSGRNDTACPKRS